MLSTFSSYVQQLTKSLYVKASSLLPNNQHVEAIYDLNLENLKICLVFKNVDASPIARLRESLSMWKASETRANDPETYPYLKTFLDYLSYLPEDEALIPEVRLSEIPSDLNIFRILQGMTNE